MADYDQQGGPVGPAADLEGSKAWCHLMYALHAVSALGGVLGPTTIVGSFLFGWPSIIAVIINYVTRDNVRDTWLDSHWRWQLRTFWFAALWAVIAVILIFTIIGIPFAWLLVLLLGLWLLYRVARGWTALLDKRPMPLPEA